MKKFIEVYTYIPDHTKVEKFKILVENIQIVYPFPENETVILDNKAIKTKHQSILKIKDFNHSVYSDIPYKDFGTKKEENKWIYPSDKLPKEKEIVIVQLDINKIEKIFKELGNTGIYNLLNDENNVYMGYLSDEYWVFKRQCYYDDGDDDYDGIYYYYADEEKDIKEEYNQIVLKWQHLPIEEKEEEQLITRFDLLDL